MIPPVMALLLWLFFLLALLYFDPGKEPEAPLALWVPVIWIFIVASRLPSQWLGYQAESAAQAYEEGNPVDRVILSILILLAVGILISRSFQWADFFLRNLALMAFLSFALMSVAWSDFPLISLKRWLRDLGGYLMVLVVLSDPRPLEAVRTLLRHLFYLLIPLSILLVKYYIKLGRQYDVWSGATMFVGATTSKNMLGAVCLISGIFFFWDTVARWPGRRERRTRWTVFVNLAFIAMTLWLLYHAHSATSTVCLGLGCLVIAAAHSSVGLRHPTALKAAIPVCFFLYLIVGFGFGMNGELAQAFGRDPTLTTRTAIWSLLIGMHTNPIVGTGYESFWLGSRLDLIWAQVGQINEAHNGYLDTYLNLGLVGLFLLLVFLIVGFRNICKRQFVARASFASFSLALWTVILFYNMTEAAFKHGLLWLTPLLGTIVLPQREEDQALDVATLDDRSATERLPSLPWELTSQQR